MENVIPSRQGYQLLIHWGKAAMLKVPLSTLVKYCDRFLQIDQFDDWPGALNGLQVENRGLVSRLAATVDASLATIELAVANRANLLLVHHGLFWGPVQPWTGRRIELLRLLLENDLAVYSAHLPLDVHPRVGNNARLCAAIGIEKYRPFFFDKGRYLGFRAALSISRDDLVRRLARALNREPLVLPGGPSHCRRIGVVTGGAGEQLRLAAEEGVDTFITGEGPHWTYALAEELGVNVIYGGHYATETFGVKALAAHVARKFKLEWQFVDHPTGL